MLRVALMLARLRSPAAAQVMGPDESLQQQLVPESFPFEATAVATKINAQLATSSLNGMVTASAANNRLRFTATWTGVEVALRVQEFPTTTFNDLPGDPNLDLNEDRIDDLLVGAVAASGSINGA